MASTDSRLPWVSTTSARMELESVSSLSLLHSIYGSQVSQVLFASDDSDASLLTEKPWARERPTRCQSARPKSSPAVTRLEGEKRKYASLRPASSAHKQQVQARPATARVRTSRAGGGAGRLGFRRVLSSVFVEDVEDAESLPRSSIQDTKPVTLTRVPEYLNFWQGKPLSKRENAIPIHTRTARKRPKSDYGSRMMAHKTSDKALATVMEGEDVGLGRSSTDQWANNKTRSTADGKQSLGLSGANGGGDGGKGRGVGRDAAAGHRSVTSTANMWAQRSKKVRPHNSSTTNSSPDDEDDFFHKNKSLRSSWLEIGEHCTKRTRFELPMDLTMLEEMSPLQYLKAHCIIRVFTRLDKDRDAHLSKQEVVLALQEALHGCLSQSQAEYLLALVLYQQNTMANLHLFAALCCLAERVFSIQLLPALAGKDMIECVDFEALEWKLRGCTIGTALHKLFTLL